MSDTPRIEEMQWRNILAGLWVFFLLNILFRVVHEFFRSGYLDQVLTGVVNGNLVTEEKLLYAAVALQVPLLMTVLSRLLNYSINRWLNMITSILMVMGVLTSNSNPDMDDMLFALMQGLALMAVFWVAWRGLRFGCLVNDRLKVKYSA